MHAPNTPSTATLAPEAAPARSTGAPRVAREMGELPYYPGLDGLRGLSVAAVLLFHAGFGWAVGGFLGVSTFFTLSGFLITSLLLSERERTDHIDLRRFWSRRFRRLMPAAFATLALVVLFGWLAADASQLRSLRGDVLAALAYVANWRFVFSDQSYGDLFAAPSPVLHFWSLAIEEQFYLIYPLLALGALKLARGSRQTLGLVLGGLTILSLGSALLLGYSDDRIYFGTDTRATELLLGALLAIFITGRARVHGPDRKLVSFVGSCALLAMVVLWSVTTENADWLYQSGFTIYAALSVAVIFAALQRRGPVATGLAWRPLVWLGEISYGVYLYHWVVFLWLDETRTGLSIWPLFFLRVAVTLALATLSYHLLEQPIRTRQRVNAHTAWRLVPAAAGAFVVALVLVTLSPPPPVIDFAAAQDMLQAAEISPTTDAPALDAGAGGPVTVPPPRVAVFGDSTALMTAVGLTTWMQESGAAVVAGGASWLGCGVGRGGERMNGFEVAPTPTGCDAWETVWGNALEEGKPDLAVVQVGPWEVTDRKLPGDDTWRTVGDPIYDEYLLGEMQAAVDLLSSDGAEVVWLTSPVVGVGATGDEVGKRGDAGDPARMERLNELIFQLEELKPGKVQIVDLAAFVAGAGDDDVRLRPDGMHFSPETSAEVARTWLGPELLGIWDGVYRAEQEEAAAAAGPLRVLVVGDSTAVMVGFGLNDWGLASEEVQVATAAEIGCGVGRGGRRDYQGVDDAIPATCDAWPERWTQALEAFDPQAVMMLTGPFDVADRLLPGDDTWRHPGDPVYDEYLLAEFEAAADLLTSSGATVYWLTSPLIDVGRADVPQRDEPWPASEPERMARLNELIEQIADERDDVVLVDYAGFLRTLDGGELDPTIRPDGVHVANEQTGIVGAWLGPELVEREEDRRKSD